MFGTLVALAVLGYITPQSAAAWFLGIQAGVTFLWIIGLAVKASK